MLVYHWPDYRGRTKEVSLIFSGVPICWCKWDSPMCETVTKSRPVLVLWHRTLLQSDNDTWVQRRPNQHGWLFWRVTGLGWAGRQGRPFGVWKMCSAVVAIRANLQLVLLAISIDCADGHPFWILFCPFGRLSQGEGVARCHLPVHRQSKQTVLVILKPASLGVAWVNICPKFGSDQMSRIQSRVGQSALPVSLHGFVLLTLGQLFHVTHKKPG